MVKIACSVLCSHIRPKLNVFIPGHGTVDSGHLCLSGYNEVVMLRRLPKGHEVNALHADEKGYFDMPHSLVRISTCTACDVSSAKYDLSNKTLVFRGKRLQIGRRRPRFTE